MWKIISMKSLINDNKVKFPCRLWNEIFTEFATTNKSFIERNILKLKEEGFTARKKIEKELSKKHNRKFYYLEIKNYEE